MELKWIRERSSASITSSSRSAQEIKIKLENIAERKKVKELLIKRLSTTRREQVRVICFGSFEAGLDVEDSDLNLLLVSNDPKRALNQALNKLDGMRTFQVKSDRRRAKIPVVKINLDGSMST